MRRCRRKATRIISTAPAAAMIILMITAMTMNTNTIMRTATAIIITITDYAGFEPSGYPGISS